jgi:hypothetical protein
MILRLKKRDNYWRMNRETFSQFIEHINIYIETKQELNNLDEEVLYAEIPDCDIKNMGLLFGYHLQDNETLLLAKVYPKFQILMPSEKIFHIKICKIINNKVSLLTTCIKRQ